MLDETLIDWYNGVALEEVLNQQGIENKVFILANSGHVTGNNPYETLQFTKTMQEYLKTYFGY